MQSQSFPYKDAFLTAQRYFTPDEDFVFLHSSLHSNYSGRYSIIACRPRQRVMADDFDVFSTTLSNNQETFDNSWFGYLNYELRHALEQLPRSEKAYIDTPALYMVNFKLIFVFDHETQRCTVYTDDPSLLDIIAASNDNQPAPPHIAEISSNMNKEAYLKAVEATIDAIKQGDISQANITRKFFGTFKENVSPLALFQSLCEASPAPYSAFLHLGGVSVLSSSPEQFLRIDAKGQALARPIKGTIGKSTDPAEDAVQKDILANSSKDKAENLMIVDLMRHDFARGSEVGSVTVEGLFNIDSYATLHHMSSTILGQKKPEISTLDFVQHCFPPGSMTGTPKIQAMKHCTEYEKWQRGIYSGTIGWFGGDGSCDLSVVIRTLILHDNRFEFQVGGAIIADSTAESEWQETLIKARGIAKVLGIESERDLLF